MRYATIDARKSCALPPKIFANSACVKYVDPSTGIHVVTWSSAHARSAMKNPSIVRKRAPRRP